MSSFSFNNEKPGTWSRMMGKFSFKKKGENRPPMHTKPSFTVLPPRQVDSTGFSVLPMRRPEPGSLVSPTWSWTAGDEDAFTATPLPGLRKRVSSDDSSDSSDSDDSDESDSDSDSDLENDGDDHDEGGSANDDKSTAELPKSLRVRARSDASNTSWFEGDEAMFSTSTKSKKPSSAHSGHGAGHDFHERFPLFLVLPFAPGRSPAPQLSPTVPSYTPFRPAGTRAATSTTAPRIPAVPPYTPFRPAGTQPQTVTSATIPRTPTAPSQHLPTANAHLPRRVQSTPWYWPLRLSPQSPGRQTLLVRRAKSSTAMMMIRPVPYRDELMFPSVFDCAHMASGEGRHVGGTVLAVRGYLESRWNCPLPDFEGAGYPELDYVGRVTWSRQV